MLRSRSQILLVLWARSCARFRGVGRGGEGGRWGHNHHMCSNNVQRRTNKRKKAVYYTNGSYTMKSKKTLRHAALDHMLGRQRLQWTNGAV